ncbi:MAG: hypothetical protein JNL21_12855 [Myxococcales bacterium]|nr:hypothetical protein [Myxococcales bacterium]
MLTRTTLLACPSCTHHVFPSDSLCPACGQKLRGADGSIARTQVALAMSLGAVFSLAGIGCGDSDGSGGGGAGGGTNTSTTTSSSKATTVTTGMMMAVSTYGVGPSTTDSSTGTSGLLCDDGTPGDIDSQLCTSCSTCAQENACADELALFEADPDALAFSDCLDACTDTTCEDACAATYASAAALYADVFACVVCEECPINCDAATNCP